MLTFYGHFSGHSSYPTVCRAIAANLVEHGVELQLGNLRDGPMAPELAHLPRAGERVMDQARHYWRVARAQGSVRTAVARESGTSLVFGFPDWLSFVPAHERSIGYHTCEVHELPPHWPGLLSSLDQGICPSRWCQTIFQGLVSEPSFSVVHHGVDPAFKPNCVDWAVRPMDGPFRFVHFCGDIRGRERKSTDEVLSAFFKLVAWADAELHLVVANDDATVYSWLHKTVSNHARVSVSVRAARPPHEQMLTLRRAHVLVAPSRAEGFGMVPREALACGIPVITTVATGHADHIELDAPGVVIVPHGPISACGLIGRAPRVATRDILEGMERAIDQYDDLRQAALCAAEAVAEEWSWDRVLEPLRQLLAET